MNTLTLKHLAGTCKISVLEGTGLSSFLESFLKAGHVIGVSDENIITLLKEKMPQFKTFWQDSIIIPSGESAKDFSVYQWVLSELVNRKATRDTMLIALGGGTIGDLTGFVAATYLRGIRYVQIPTTFLAMIDSSIGGKTGINLPEGKNLIGAFWHPEQVLVDTTFLHSLPLEEIRSGMGEMFKYALLSGEKETLEFQNWMVTTDLKSGSAWISSNAFTTFLLHGIQTKIRIVESDERERHERQFLNLGHTLAHGLEKTCPGIRHGEAVTIGLLFSVYFSAKYLNLSPDWMAVAVQVAQKLFPDGSTLYQWPHAELLSFIRMDKKKRQNHLNFVGLTKPGEPIITPVDSIEKLIEDMHQFNAEILKWPV